MKHPNCLMARVLKARYFPDGDILTAQPRKKSSYAWKSLLHGRDLIRQGMRYIVADGSAINMWTDPWLPLHPPRPPRSWNQQEQDVKINTFFNESKTDWDYQKLREVVEDQDLNIIATLKISVRQILIY